MANLVCNLLSPKYENAHYFSMAIFPVKRAFEMINSFQWFLISTVLINFSHFSHCFHINTAYILVNPIHRIFLGLTTDKNFFKEFLLNRCDLQIVAIERYFQII